MLYDLHAHRRKGLLFALGLDHHVGFPAANAAEQRLPVAAVHRVCVRAGLLGGVLAGGCKVLTGSIRRENHQTITVPGARIFSSRLLQELAGRH